MERCLSGRKDTLGKRAYKKLYRGFESRSLRQKIMKNCKTKKTILLISTFSVIIPIIVFTILFIQHPLSTYTYLDWLGDPTISDYGQITETKLLMNTTLIIYGLINIINVITILTTSKTKKILSFLLLISSIGILGVGILPIPVTETESLKNLIHWTLGGFAILLQPLLLIFIQKDIKTKKILLHTFLMSLTVSSLWYFFNNYQKLVGEIIMGINTMIFFIITNIHCIKQIEQEGKQEKLPFPEAN